MEKCEILSTVNPHLKRKIFIHFTFESMIFKCCIKMLFTFCYIFSTIPNALIHCCVMFKGSLDVIWNIELLFVNSTPAGIF